MPPAFRRASNVCVACAAVLLTWCAADLFTAVCLPAMTWQVPVGDKVLRLGVDGDPLAVAVGPPSASGLRIIGLAGGPPRPPPRPWLPGRHLPDLRVALGIVPSFACGYALLCAAAVVRRAGRGRPRRVGFGVVVRATGATPTRSSELVDLTQDRAEVS